VRVFGAVTLERVAIPVVSEAICLNDQPAVTPEEVDFVRTDTCVDLWLGEAVAAAEAEKKTLELGASEVGIGTEVVRTD
jgi:hypothetical protein